MGCGLPRVFARLVDGFSFSVGPMFLAHFVGLAKPNPTTTFTGRYC